MSYIQSNVLVQLPLNNGAGVTVTYPLFAADSGKVFLMPLPTINAANVLAIQLPAVAISAGVHYKFIVSSSGLTGATITIASPTSATPACLRSLAVANSAAAGTGGSAAGNAFLTILTLACVTAGTTLTNIGDNIDAYCDGAHWLLQVNSNLANAAALA